MVNLGNLSISPGKTPPTPPIRRLLVIPFRKYMTSHILQMLSKVPDIVEISKWE